MEEEKRFLHKQHFNTHKTSAEQKERMWQEIEAQMDTKTTATYYPMLRVVKWAASVAAVSALIFFTISSFFPSDISHQTAFAEMQNIALPDGSEVVLNANSSLKYSPSWKDKEVREVWLEGEGHFSIISAKKRSNKPFIVHTSQGDIKVTGTVFNANTRDRGLRVLLTEGIVELLLDDQTAVQIQEGELVSYQNELKRGFPKNTAVFTSWTQKKLVFDETPLSHSINFIEEHYGYEVQLNNKELLDQKLTGTLPNPNLDVLLKAIENAFGVKVKRTKESILTIEK